MISAVTILICAVQVSFTSESTTEQERFFEAKVRPLLVKHCLQCHAGEQAKGSLRLDSRDGWQAGGDSGAAIIPGKPEQSLLIRAVSYADGASGMPPKEKLAPRDIETLTRWVAGGAIDPRDSAGPPRPAADTAAADSHWGFQPLQVPTLLPPRDSWPQGPIDCLVSAAHRAAGLTPAADAPPHTWLRRVTLDLTGLPPTTHEITAFVSDDSPDADRRVVDRLLNSRKFGEKWARHWLDLACYADTIGSSSMPMRHAWRYRDFVIGALNEDKPWDEFVRQQLAGDLLPASSPQQRRENLVATGFLAIGPWQLSEQDKQQLRMDVVDHQISRIGTMFLGMTLDCARCHDHKFDPIDQRDYYALAGVFANVDVLQGIWRSNVTDLVTVELPELPDERQARQRAAVPHLAQLTQAMHAWRSARQALEEAEAELGIGAASDGAGKQAAELTKLRKAAATAEAEWRFLEFHTPSVPRAHAVVQRRQLENVRINVRGSVHALGDEVPRGFVPIIQPQHEPIERSSSGRLELADWLFSPENPLTARVLVNRIWSQLFGRGLVEPVDYFGLGAGDNRPTNPELLDYLADRLMRHDWSLKMLLREIVLSRTYRLASAPNLPPREIDPENRLLWRANPRRMDAEMIRDSMLMLGGRLLPHPGGPSIPLDDRAALRPGDLVNPPTVGGGFEVPERIRRARSIYQPVIRSYFHKSLNVLELFDTPSPNEIVGDRVTTTLPTQSLFLLNSPFVKQCAGQLAELIMRESNATDEERLSRLWLRALGRPIDLEQQQAALEFLDATADRSKAWKRLCHSLMVSNEFLFRY